MRQSEGWRVRSELTSAISKPRKIQFTLCGRLHHTQAHSCGKKGARETRLHYCPRNFHKLLMTTLATALFSANAFCQTICCQATTFGPETPANADPVPKFDAVQNFNVSALRAETFDDDTTGNAAAQHAEQQPGLVHRAVKRILEDQKGIYLSPFEPSHLKYDAIFLAGTAAFLVTDRHIENNLPGGHYQFYADSSNIAIGSLAATLGGVWLYGIKGDHRHARETGELELETLANTFLAYTPLQVIVRAKATGMGIFCVIP